VRVVSWVFVLCALAAATGVFMPCLELTAVRTKHGSVSLYEASTHRALARKLIAAYQKSRGRALGELITGAALKHVKNEYVGDASDAMSTLDEVSDQDVAMAGTALVVAIWLFLALQAIGGVLVLGQLVGDVWRRRRLVAIVAMAVVSSVIGVAMMLVCREAAWQANDEIGRAVLGAGTGVYVMTVASLAGLACAIVTLVAGARRTS